MTGTVQSGLSGAGSDGLFRPTGLYRTDRPLLGSGAAAMMQLAGDRFGLTMSRRAFLHAQVYLMHSVSIRAPSGNATSHYVGHLADSRDVAHGRWC